MRGEAQAKKGEFDTGQGSGWPYFLGQSMMDRANIPFRYAPTLALTPFSLLVADSVAEPL